jgi:hypothetical protein
MDKKLFLAALAEAKKFGLYSLRLGMTGEPLLIDDIDRYVAISAEAGLKDISLITNGQWLTYGLSTRLIKAGLTRLMISVDAATPETYAKVRPGGDFGLLTENITNFLKARSDLSSRLPLLRLSFVVMDQNRDELTAFREKFSPLADYLAFQSYLDILGNNGSRKPNTSAANVKPTNPLPVKEKNSKPTIICPDPLTRMALMADGGLFPCCSDFGRLNPLGRFPDNSLLEIWNHPKAKSLAENPDQVSCRRCLAASGREYQLPQGHQEANKKPAANECHAVSLKPAARECHAVILKPAASGMPAASEKHGVITKNKTGLIEPRINIQNRSLLSLCDGQNGDRPC